MVLKKNPLWIKYIYWESQDRRKKNNGNHKFQSKLWVFMEIKGILKETNVFVFLFFFKIWKNSIDNFVFFSAFIRGELYKDTKGAV